ncbi:magnesium transporter [Atopomonas sediminilitoris]|uniref:magnesium transporter n=1 Tax=Atopomonas sediminilitoris TaxID=2919919 RepID=UPI001F4E2E0B|nr:magnesium transporter [Atopomonas sediminilitoris]MCJ8170051.1 magnesium transporter [Atopomonas sediminilitoris]
MSKPAVSPSQQSRVDEVRDALARLHRLDDLAQRQQGLQTDRVELLSHRQALVDLERRLAPLHPADVADVLEALPLDERLLVWQHVQPALYGEVLLEVSDAVREHLLENVDTAVLQQVAEHLAPDDLADLAQDMSRAALRELFETLDVQRRARLRSVLAYREDQVGALMDFELPSVREDVSLASVLEDLRRSQALPEPTDKLFVVNQQGQLTGVLPLRRLLLSAPEQLVSQVMAREPVTFHPEDAADDAAEAFERYDLITAPVLDHQQRLVGRLVIDDVLDHIREESQQEALHRAGLREEEDIFAGVWRSVRNRWAWLAVNLVTAFIASRVIDAFEGTIEQLVALAALMPIVAGIGGNSGNQTITMIVRALALDQVDTGHTRRLLFKELGVSLANGLIWGSVLGLAAWLLYDSAWLGLVMTAAMTLNLLLAALMGVVIPMLQVRFGRDPAIGSSVIITAITDSGGFFIFLGLASVMLL